MKKPDTISRVLHWRRSGEGLNGPLFEGAALTALKEHQGQGILAKMRLAIGKNFILRGLEFVKRDVQRLRYFLNHPDHQNIWEVLLHGAPLDARARCRWRVVRSERIIHLSKKEELHHLLISFLQEAQKLAHSKDVSDEVFPVMLVQTLRKLEADSWISVENERESPIRYQIAKLLLDEFDMGVVRSREEWKKFPFKSAMKKIGENIKTLQPQL